MRTQRFLLALIAQLSVLAQTPLEQWENLGQVRTGQRLEVVDKKMKPVQGQFVSYTQEAILLRVGQDQVSIPRTEVASVKDREGPSRARNVLVGMAMGAAGGLAAGVIRGKTYHEEGETSVFVLVYTPIGAGIGAGVGAVLPAGQKTIYRVGSL